MCYICRHERALNHNSNGEPELQTQQIPDSAWLLDTEIQSQLPSVTAQERQDLWWEENEEMYIRMGEEDCNSMWETQNEILF